MQDGGGDPLGLRNGMPIKSGLIFSNGPYNITKSRKIISSKLASMKE